MKQTVIIEGLIPFSNRVIVNSYDTDTKKIILECIEIISRADVYFKYKVLGEIFNGKIRMCGE